MKIRGYATLGKAPVQIPREFLSSKHSITGNVKTKIENTIILLLKKYVLCAYSIYCPARNYPPSIPYSVSPSCYVTVFFSKKTCGFTSTDFVLFEFVYVQYYRPKYRKGKISM